MDGRLHPEVAVEVELNLLRYLLVRTGVLVLILFLVLIRLHLNLALSLWAINAKNLLFLRHLLLMENGLDPGHVQYVTSLWSRQ